MLTSEYKIEAQFGPPDMPIKDEGWRVYRATYTSHYDKKSVAKTYSKRTPRWKMIEVFETESQAREYVKARNGTLVSFRGWYFGECESH